MGFTQVSDEELRAARIITGATMAAVILVGVVPRLRSYALPLRKTIVVAYIAIAAGFMVWLMIR